MANVVEGENQAHCHAKDFILHKYITIGIYQTHIWLELCLQVALKPVV